jgi:hypothetical protein
MLEPTSRATDMSGAAIIVIALFIASQLIQRWRRNQSK